MSRESARKRYPPAHRAMTTTTTTFYSGSRGWNFVRRVNDLLRRAWKRVHFEDGIAWVVGFEFTPEDLWIGIFWKVKWEERWMPRYSGHDVPLPPTLDRLDVWLCIIPTFPIRFIRIASPDNCDPDEVPF